MVQNNKDSEPNSKLHDEDKQAKVFAKLSDFSSISFNQCVNFKTVTQTITEVNALNKLFVHHRSRLGQLTESFCWRINGDKRLAGCRK